MTAGVALILLLALPLIGFGWALWRGMDKLGLEVAKLQERDALTGCWLKPAFVARAADALKNGGAGAGRAFMFAVEIDKSSEIDRVYGTMAVDEALIALANLTAGPAEGGHGASRESARSNGRRLLSWFRAKDSHEARQSLAQLQSAFERLDLRFGGAPVDLTLSMVFGSLQGSRQEDIEAAMNGLETRLDAKAGSKLSQIIEFDAPERQKRTFFRDQAERALVDR